MLFFGDRRSVVDVRHEWTARGESLRPGLRPDALRDLLVTHGALVQAALDEHARDRGTDDHGPVEASLLDALVAFARATWSAWNRSPIDVDVLRKALASVDPALLPTRAEVREPEGFAFYAVYPEQYAAAAARLRVESNGSFVVIGLRSIGTTLGAMVAAVLDAPLVTIRPGGDPFRRTLSIGPSLDQLVRTAPVSTRFAIVDEGPGLSGSSFGAVADWLASSGIATDRLDFFPSHANELGPRACAAHRDRWRTARRHHVPFESLVRPRLFESLRADGAIEELSGGAWRALVGGDDWPAWPRHERLKYRFHRDGRPLVARFAGLGASGASKVAVARRLSATGHVPAFVDASLGFFVEEWIDGTVPTRVSIDELARYLATRRSLGETTPGAEPDLLLAMVVRNVGLALGDEAARRAEARWRPLLGWIARRRRPIAVDGRLHRWEWRRTAGGRLVKLDAIDHHAGHDLVGAQDLAWDVAGAALAFELPPTSERSLARLLDVPEDDFLDFHRLALTAFQLGAWTFARDDASDASARRVLDTERARLESRLRAALDEGRRPSRPAPGGLGG